MKDLDNILGSAEDEIKDILRRASKETGYDVRFEDGKLIAVYRRGVPVKVEKPRNLGPFPDTKAGRAHFKAWESSLGKEKEESYGVFLVKICADFPRVSSLRPVTYDQYVKGLAAYGEKAMMDILAQMEDWRDIKKRMSAGGTMLNWLGRRNQRQKTVNPLHDR